MTFSELLLLVAPARERGLKSAAVRRRWLAAYGRSREGAWIEIYIHFCTNKKSTVAPARERGLKFPIAFYFFSSVIRRSREGAWIEILSLHVDYQDRQESLPRGSVD